MAQFTVVILTSFTMLSYDKLGFLNCYVACTIILCNIFLIGVITKTSSLITDTTAKTIVLLRKSDEVRPVRWVQIIMRPVREIRIYIGNFYYADPGTLLVSFDVILNNIISLLLGLRWKDEFNFGMNLMYSVWYLLSDLVNFKINVQLFLTIAYYTRKIKKLCTLCTTTYIHLHVFISDQHCEFHGINK